MADGQVLIEITADNRDVKQTLRDTTNELNSAGQKWEKQGDAMSGVFKKIAGAITAAGIGKALLSFGKDAVEAASKLQEVQNVVDVTFGNSSKEIDRWAKDAIKQFGLTETQAKKFTSTLGAMMKSSGVAGDDIVKMSTDLSGLAADMASFYNLDFETAFQKIRSGISGETEPLKQLGINMSVVNLEAYAMTQGITKSFAEMSQGEQVMLRYQYMMQATADAQGDFARTSDGFANATRLLESNLDSLKAKLGGPVMTGLNWVLSTVNDLVDKLSGDSGQHTILDTFADIDMEKQAKLEEVRITANTARELVGILQGLEKEGFRVTAVSDFANGANLLDSTSPGNWESLLTTFQTNISGVQAIWNESDPGGGIKSLATALSGLEGGTTKAEAWKTMLQALSENADGIASMSGMSTKEVRALLDKFAQDAGKINENDATAWDNLLTAFATSFPDIITSTTLQALGQNIGGIATNANGLRSTAKSNWEAFATAVQSIDGLTNIWGGSVDGVEALAAALSNQGITKSRAEAWQTMIGALKENIGIISGLHGDSEDATAAWLETLANAANQINPEDAAAWDTLFGWLVEGLPGLSETQEGRALIAALTGAAELTNGGTPQQTTRASNDAVEIMEMLGIATEEVNDQQSLWLATCRELVKQIPALSRIINTETGEIIGGTQAVRDYISAWEEQSVEEIYINALQQKMNELDAKIHENRANTTVRRAMAYSHRDYGRWSPSWTSPVTADDVLDEYAFLVEALYDQGKTKDDIKKILMRRMSQADRTLMQGDGTGLMYRLGDTTDASLHTQGASMVYWSQAMTTLWETEEARKSVEEYIDAVYDNVDARKTIPEAKRVLQEERQRVIDEGIAREEELAEAYGDVADAANGAANAVADLTEEQEKGWHTAIDAVTKATQAVVDYQNKVIESTRNTIQAWGNVWEEVQTDDEKTLAQIEKDLEDFKGNKSVEFEIRVGTSGIKSAQNMLNNVMQRWQRMAEYRTLMDEAQAMGYSADVLAEVADGSLESLDALRALTAQGVSPEMVQDINTQFQIMKGQEEELAQTLAAYRLDADEEYAFLVNDLQNALNELDAMTPTDNAANAIGQSIDWVMNTIESKYPQLKSDLDSLRAVIREMESFGVSTRYSTFGTKVGGGHATGIGGFSVTKGWTPKAEPEQLAVGMDFVPYDGFLAQLHRGESVLTAQEAQIWREFRSGIDANSLAGAIWDNSPDMGGNVYLNGEIVGRIMSGVQADSYRQLERSGWRG